MRLKSSGDRDRGGYPAVRYERGVVAESPTLCVGFGEGEGIAINLFYLYDAGGIKLSEQVKIGNKVSKTDYVGGFIYQGGKLAMVQHAEGRIVPKYGKWDYQYHLKDHLGNVRLTFSNMAERHTVVEDFEGQNHGFKNLHVHTNVQANTTKGGNKVERLASGQSGAMLLMKVNRGDTLSLQVKANYETPPAKNSLLPIGYTALFGAFNASYGGALEGVANNASNAMNQALSSANMTSKGAKNTAPRAFLNYIYFDKNMQHVRSGFKQISTAAQGIGRYETIAINEILADQEGYVLAYLSNENKEPVQVHFDDFTILHKKTNIVQSQDYYPFGLTFNKYKRAGAFENDFLFGGKELNEETGWLDFHARMYAPDLGRFLQSDPLAASKPSWTAYRFGYDNPVNFVDPTGMMERRNDPPSARERIRWIRLMHKMNPRSAYYRKLYNRMRSQRFAESVRFATKKVGPRRHGVSRSGPPSYTSAFIAAAGHSLLLSDEFRAGSNGKYVHSNGKTYSNRFYGNKGVSKYSVRASKLNTATTTRFVSKVSNGLVIAGAALTVYDGISNGWQNHHTADLVVTGGFYVLAASVPVAGWIVGGAYFAADLTTQYYTGKSITENLFD